MKRIKIAFAALAALTLVVASFAFTTKKAHKPLSTTDYYYFDGTDRQRIEYGHLTDADLKERSPESNSGADFKNTGNWTTTAQTFAATSSMTRYISKITFTEDATLPGNGGSDGDLTLQEALNAVYADYATNHVMASSVTVGSVVITVTPTANVRP